ncbi:hypothetical protein IMX07_10840 [bacterium]|jgi:hypothetical protein|nr:hypothetical protein [bacterium]
MRILIVALILLAAPRVQAQAFDPGASAAPLTTLAPERWYWGAYSPDRTKEIWVGPYGSLANCRDMLGSATYAHPFACHVDGPNPPSNCRIIGNGFAYPAHWGFPVPADRMMVSYDCVKLPRAGANARRWGWYFLSGANSSDVELKMCVDGNYRKALKAARAKGSTAWIAHYSDWRCPGWPCFSVGVDTACE